MEEKSRTETISFIMLSKKEEYLSEAKDSSNKSTMPLKEYLQPYTRPSLANTATMILFQVSSLLKTIKECNGRAVLDQEAFDNFI
jgi:hypothetical protein